MKKFIFFLLVFTAFNNFVFSQEENLFETTWESDNGDYFQIIFLKDFLFINADASKNSYAAVEVFYENKKIIEKEDPDFVYYYYEVYEDYIKLSYAQDMVNSKILKQVPTSHDIKNTTKFQGVWTWKNHYGNDEKTIFYGNYYLTPFHKPVFAAIKFSYDDKQIFLSYNESEFQYDYVLAGNVLKLNIRETTGEREEITEVILYRE